MKHMYKHAFGENTSIFPFITAFLGHMLSVPAVLTNIFYKINEDRSRKYRCANIFHSFEAVTITMNGCKVLTILGKYGHWEVKVH